MSEQEPVSDLFDLKMLPSWVKESPNENRYADFAGEEEARPFGRERTDGQRRERRPRPPRRNEPRRDGRGERERAPRRPEAPREPAENFAPLPKLEIRFVPDARALESVLAQIKSGHVAYSVFALARMFLEKPERYDVRLKAEDGALFQIGENGPAASDRRLLENRVFPNERENFYRVEVTQTEPIKGNFANVARERSTGTLLGPTNHHAYQLKLRGLYEQRFSRRMSFPEFQRQIEIVSDPEVVERWKEEARSVTTYTTLQEEPPQTFQNLADAERHFRQNYLANLVRESAELTLDGVASRQLPDRALSRLIEVTWVQETRSPSKMMQELIAAFPANGLHLFRYRKATLFVSPVRPRPFGKDVNSLSKAVAAILQVLTENPTINRKQLLEKLSPADGGETTPEEAEKRKLALASDVRWLVSEGHVIEFNDGTLDLARVKTPTAKAPPSPKETPPNDGTKDVPATAEPIEKMEETPNEPASAEITPE
ncbi:MAG TPA: hypothetical protein VHW03_03330 [Chthoniobacterales bacterium]|nr:hypothetical protein [Chthoniobacterales bacterium]